MNILLICGESSSNAYGVELAKVLKSKGHFVFSVGDFVIAKESNQIMRLDSTQHSIYFGQLWAKRQFKNEFRQKLSHLISANGCDRVVIIDFPNYNFMIADIVQSFNIPIISFITPNFWIWKNQLQAKKLIKYSQKIITIFKKEYEFYSQFTDKVHYLGHPITVHNKPYNKHDNMPYFRYNVMPENDSVSDELTVVIYPGSRHSEIKLQLPKILNVISQLSLNESCRYILVCSDSRLKKTVATIVNQMPFLNILIQNQYNGPVDLAIVVPGTMPMILALNGIPMVVIGMLKPFTYFFAKYIFRLNIPNVSMRNIVLDQRVSPEFVQHQNSIQTIAKTIESLLMRPIKAWAQSEQLMRLNQHLKSDDNFYEKVASIITLTV